MPNIVLDMIILALPLSAVWQLQMSTPQKVGVGGIFLLGGLYVSRILDVTPVNKFIGQSL